MLAISLAKLIFVARNALAAYFTISADGRSVRITWGARFGSPPGNDWSRIRW